MTTHTAISYIKSGIRILGYFVVAHQVPAANLAMLILIVAECGGIIEEFGAKYK